ncbi:MAG TPA: tetratricopeptide repeat protein, partial [Nitrospira sp.]|nr:tetratricopeptide repeat protein [Nitrospira sp.]
ANEINPQLSDMYINRGVSLGQMGNLRQSIASLTEGIRLAPENPDGYFNRGTAYFQQGDLDRAMEDFSSVIRLSPRDESAYYWRAISNEEAGHRDEAIADYKQFLELSQDPIARKDVEQKLSQWNAGKQKRVSDQVSVTSEPAQKTDQTDSQKPEQALDLYELIVALGERALRSTWFGRDVNCYGEGAEELLSFTDQNEPIEGEDFLRITSGIQQTLEGDFTAFDPNASSHWILIRAWKGNGFYIETIDRKNMERLRAQFPVVEDVEGASSPYKGLFIPLPFGSSPS